MNNIKYMKNLPNIIEVKRSINSGFGNELELNKETLIYETLYMGKVISLVTAEFYYHNKGWFNIVKQ